MSMFSRLSLGGKGSSPTKAAASSKPAGVSAAGIAEEQQKVQAQTTRGVFSGTAGSTIEKLDEGEAETGQCHRWTHCEASTFSTRVGPSYSKLKQKAPSAKALTELVGVDIVRTSHRIDKIGSRMRVPADFANINTNAEGVPALFIVNCQVPSDFPSTFSFTETTDGPGWSIVYYFKVTEETANGIANLATASAAIKLFVDYCRNAPEMDGDPKSVWKGRFKAMYRCENMGEFGLPSFITSYNAKPVLINRTGVLSRGVTLPSSPTAESSSEAEGPSVEADASASVEKASTATTTAVAAAAAPPQGHAFIEMDINLHKFSSIAKKGLQTLIPYFEKMVVTSGFCIESINDAEMPECLFGVASCIRANYKVAPDYA